MSSMTLDRPYESLDDAVRELTALERLFREARDRRAIFLTVYGTVSQAVRRRVADGFFGDNAWVGRYTVAFANLYRTALHAYERKAPVPRAWTLCFDAALRGDGLVLQDLLLGVNAHINRDLAVALSEVSIGPDREARYRDHVAVNEVLASVMQEATDRLSLAYAPGLAGLDELAGELDEMLGVFSLEVARESAWESAASLANARHDLERRLALKLLETRAALLARLLLKGSISPAFVKAVRRIEAGQWWTMI
jgi:hypothetical protein